MGFMRFHGAITVTSTADYTPKLGATFQTRAVAGNVGVLSHKEAKQTWVVDDDTADCLWLILDHLLVLCMICTLGVLMHTGLLWVKPTALPKARSSSNGVTAPVVDDSDIPILPEIDVSTAVLCACLSAIATTLHNLPCL